MERLKKEREGKKKKIKEKIPKDLEDIGIWNNIETIENNYFSFNHCPVLLFLYIR
jgi:hypothetical protein